MEYIIILNPDAVSPVVLTDINGELMTFASYENAREIGDTLADNNTVEDYTIYDKTFKKSEDDKTK